MLYTSTLSCILKETELGLRKQYLDAIITSLSMFVNTVTLQTVLEKSINMAKQQK